MRDCCYENQKNILIIGCGGAGKACLVSALKYFKNGSGDFVENGEIIIEHSSNISLIEKNNKIDERKYGSSILSFIKKKHIRLLAIYLILLSIILETFHLIIPERSFEWSDLLGNLLGVFIVIISNILIKKYGYFKK